MKLNYRVALIENRSFYINIPNEDDQDYNKFLIVFVEYHNDHFDHADDSIEVDHNHVLNDDSNHLHLAVYIEYVQERLK